MAETKVEGRLGVIQRRKLGLTFRNALRVARQLNAEDQLVTDDEQIAAAQVAARMVAENPEMFKAAAAEDDRDWEEFFSSLIAFIEKLMPLILQLIEIFSAV